MSLQDDFLAEIHAFLAARKMDATMFGREAMNDPNFVFQVEHGRCVRLDTVDKVRAFMAAHRPGPIQHKPGHSAKEAG
jgi:hypothetical protein